MSQAVSVSDVHPSTLETSHRITDGVAHQTSLRSQRDHDDSCELPSHGRRVAYSFCRSRSTDHISTQASPHTGLTAPPLRDGARRQNSS